MPPNAVCQGSSPRACCDPSAAACGRPSEFATGGNKLQVVKDGTTKQSAFTPRQTKGLLMLPEEEVQHMNVGRGRRVLEEVDGNCAASVENRIFEEITRETVTGFGNDFPCKTGYLGRSIEFDEVPCIAEAIFTRMQHGDSPREFEGNGGAYVGAGHTPPPPPQARRRVPDNLVNLPRANLVAQFPQPFACLDLGEDVDFAPPSDDEYDFQAEWEARVPLIFADEDS